MLELASSIVLLLTVVAPFWFIHQWITWVRDGKIGGTVKGPNGTELSLRIPEKTGSLLPSGEPTQTEQLNAIAAPPIDNVEEPQLEEDPRFAVWRPIFSARMEASLDALNKAWREGSAHLSSLTDKDRELIEAQFHVFKIELGDEQAVPALISLSASNPRWRAPAVRLAEHYRSLGQLDDALHWCNVAIARAKEQNEHSIAYSLLLDIKEATHGTDTMLDIAHSMLREVSRSDTKGAILKTIAEAHARVERYDASAAYFQLALRQTPSDLDLRFAAAFSISSGDINEILAFAHYRALQRVSPSKDYVLNNLANSCGTIGSRTLYGHFVEAAKTVNRDLAAANIAMKLAETGLIDLARAALDERPREKDLHHVNAAREYIDKREREVGPTLESLDQSARLFFEFYEVCGTVWLAKGKAWANPWPDGVWTDKQHTSMTSTDGSVFERVVTLHRHQARYEGTLQIRGGGLYQGWLELKGKTTLLSGDPDWLYVRAIRDDATLWMLLDTPSSSPDLLPVVDLVRFPLTT